MMGKKIWLITGVSKGLGKALAEEVISDGDFVIGTFRDQDQADNFSTYHSGKALGLVLHLDDPNHIKRALDVVEDGFGRLDVLVNNAGFGLVGAVEETSVEEAREIFEINFFGPLKLTQTFLPVFRRQKGGHIIQISSHGGLKAFAGFGIYNATKFALEGFSEALALEIATLGIKLTIIEPGPLRTNFAGDSLRQALSTIDDYAETAGKFRDRIKQVDGKQEGDPVKAARAIVSITLLDLPPLRLPLGKTALASIAAKLESVSNDVSNFKSVAEDIVY